MAVTDSSQSPLWSPSAEKIQQTSMHEFASQAASIADRDLSRYEDLHQWSIDNPEAFWRLVWESGAVLGEQGDKVLVPAHEMKDSRWFPAANLNFAENLLRESGNEEAIVFWGEDKKTARLTRAALRAEVGRFAAALEALGVAPGDRVAAYMPNMPETVIAMLAASSIGAVFTSASPDFGVQGILDRFGQTEPKVLLTVDGYWYNGKAIDIRDKLAELEPQLPSLQQTVVVPYLDDESSMDINSIENAVSYGDFLAAYTHIEQPEYKRLPFDHPLYILYSSGTTGAPKCIVHSAGGTLLQHLKEHRLHADIHEGDRLFYYTTCGWMMWNWLVSGLAAGATLMLYDGNPFVHGAKILWELAEQERVSHFGVSAKYIEALEKKGLQPSKQFELGKLRSILSTGSPLSPQSFEFVYQAIKADVHLASISGGTDIVSCFVLGNPCLPVWRGEIQCRGLGMAVEVWDENGQPLSGGKGELVCVKPFPSMPIGFWGDNDDAKYHSAYFERFPGVWCHGDYCEVTEHGGLIIHGRSDTTLNPQGVRIGTAEIYRQVEKLPQILESVVIGQKWPLDDPTDVRVILFVSLKEGVTLDSQLISDIKQTIKLNASPRHVPAKVLQVRDIPRTKSGKIVELAVRDVVHGLPIKNVEALANPEALEDFRDLEELKTR